jgi:hypothetical protein
MHIRAGTRSQLRGTTEVRLRWRSAAPRRSASGSTREPSGPMGSIAAAGAVSVYWRSGSCERSGGSLRYSGRCIRRLAPLVPEATSRLSATARARAVAQRPRSLMSSVITYPARSTHRARIVADAVVSAYIREIASLERDHSSEPRLDPSLQRGPGRGGDGRRTFLSGRRPQPAARHADGRVRPSAVRSEFASTCAA